MTDMNYINDCGASKVYIYIYYSPWAYRFFKQFFYCSIIGHKKSIQYALLCGAGGPTGRGPGMARVMPTGEKEILLVKNFEIVCVRGGA
jgi:hypothetical protein